jgi:galactokinase
MHHSMSSTRHSTPEPVARARQAFHRRFGREPAGVAFAPGRVNLIGEHTDYNDGFVLPMALEEGIAAAYAGRPDGVLEVFASDFDEAADAPLAALTSGTDQLATGNWKVPTGWFRYAAGVAWAMRAADVPLQGARIVTAANLPSDGGLSSSAAFELAIARALIAVAGLRWDPTAVSLMAQRAEHEFTGVACGIMDQMAVACAMEGRALLLDCRSLEIRHVALPDDVRIVVMNSGVRRSLTTSAYNERRHACERAVAAVQTIDPSVRALRDVDDVLLERAASAMDAIAFKRASHVVAENLRPARFAAALEAGECQSAGREMLESHVSLRDLYDVSCRELDVLVARSMEQPGCYGARLTGAGFGGCAIALVKNGAVTSFREAISKAYAAETGRTAEIIVSRPSAGARLV